MNLLNRHRLINATEDLRKVLRRPRPAPTKAEIRRVFEELKEPMDQYIPSTRDEADTGKKVQVRNCCDCPMLRYDTQEAYSWCAHPSKDSPSSTDDGIAGDGIPKACPLRKGALVVEAEYPR